MQAVNALRVRFLSVLLQELSQRSSNSCFLLFLGSNSISFFLGCDSSESESLKLAAIVEHLTNVARVTWTKLNHQQNLNSYAAGSFSALNWCWIRFQSLIDTWLEYGVFMQIYYPRPQSSEVCSEMYPSPLAWDMFDHKPSITEAEGSI